MAGDLFLESDSDLRRYATMFDHLRAVALSPSETVGLLGNVARPAQEPRRRVSQMITVDSFSRHDSRKCPRSSPGTRPGQWGRLSRAGRQGTVMCLFCGRTH
jgi:Domain of unknown function (DUF5753)